MVVDCYMVDAGSLQEQGISVDLSEVLDQDEDLGVDQAKLQGKVESNRYAHLVPHPVEMSDLLLFGLLCLNRLRRLVVDSAGFTHPLALELLDLAPPRHA